MVAEGGREARTEYRVLEHLGDYTLLEAYPRTGRTHQIRVHLASIGHPVAGDAVYGSRKTGRLFPRQFLHAQRICLVLPASDSQREFEAELPDDLRQSLGTLKAQFHPT